MTARLAREEGIFAGISTGATPSPGAHRLAERLGPDAVIVTLAVDSAFKYMTVSPFAELAWRGREVAEDPRSCVSFVVAAPPPAAGAIRRQPRRG